MLFITTDGAKGQLIEVDKGTVARQYALAATHQYATAYCPRSHLIAAHQSNGCALFLSPATQQPVQRSFSPEVVSCCAVSPCGTYMVAGTVSGTLLVWSLLSGQLLRNCKAHLRRIACVSFSSDGSLLATASEDSLCKVWTLAALLSLKTSELSARTTFSGHTLGVNCCGFFHAASLVFTGSADKTCRVFDATSGAQIRSYTIGDAVTSAAVRADDAVLVAGTESGFLYFHSFVHTISQLPCSRHGGESEEGDTVLREPHPDAHHSSIVFIAFCAADISTVLTVSRGGALLWYDAREGKLLGECSPKRREKVLSCCFVREASDVKRPSAANLSKNPIDPSLVDYTVVRDERRPVSDATAATSVRPGEDAEDEAQKTLGELLAHNAELESLKQRLAAKLRKIST